MIVLDTSVLSLAFRRRRAAEQPPAAKVLRKLIMEKEPLAIPGIVLQEVLSGVRTDAEFKRLRNHLEGFPVLMANRRHHILAAQVANACRRVGVVASTVDCLIAALTIHVGGRLFTLDQDFFRMAPHCKLKLFSTA